MTRQVFLNSAPNVHLYATEGGTNVNNCQNCSGTCGDSQQPSPIVSWTIALVSSGATIALTAALGKSSQEE